MISREQFFDGFIPVEKDDLSVPDATMVHDRQLASTTDADRYP
ncbi:MAG: hypothetical protein ACXAEU_19940 [Candidatus Hodarchaeales archaeon]|jgi:hypothetical protein